uniref:Phd/F-box containing protein n=1 Tax=Solanum tuberosum TaxID=4113 RepID=M1ARF4_SOLTU
MGANPVVVYRGQVTFRQKTLQSWQMKVATRMKKNMVKHYADVVMGITMLMNFGLVVISARDGSMVSA